MPRTDVVFALVGDVRRNSRAIKQLRVLRDMGLQVTALTLGPEAPAQGWEDGIQLHVIPCPPGSGPRFFWRMHRAAIDVAQTISAAIYHASDLYMLPAMVASAQKHGGKVVYDARERYPYVASTAGRPWVQAFWRVLECRYVHRADAVFTVSESIAEHMAAAYGIAKPNVLYNVPPFRAVTSSGKLRAAADVPDDAVLILHQGQMRKHRGGEVLVEAMTHVHGGVLVFMGDGGQKPVLAARAQTLGVHDRVRFLPPVPPDDLLSWTADADIGVTLLEDTCLNHRFALPNKLFEYLMAGVPVLGSDLPEVRQVVQEHAVGCVVNPADPAAVARILQSMIDDAETRQRWQAQTAQVFAAYNWEAAADVLRQTYATLRSS